jgi:hypothetical protein
VDRAEFERVTEKQLLLVLARELGAAYSAAFVASVQALPAGSAAFEDAAAANGTVIALRRRSLLAGAGGATAIEEWLQVVVVVGGNAPLRLFNATLLALRWEGVRGGTHAGRAAACCLPMLPPIASHLGRHSNLSPPHLLPCAGAATCATCWRCRAPGWRAPP